MFEKICNLFCALPASTVSSLVSYTGSTVLRYGIAEPQTGCSSSVAVHVAITTRPGRGISLPWGSETGCVTKTELEVWTWRNWKVLFEVQSTAYAGLELGVPDGVDTACDFMDSLCRLDPGILLRRRGGRGGGVYTGGFGDAMRSSKAGGSSSRRNCCCS